MSCVARPAASSADAAALRRLFTIGPMFSRVTAAIFSTSASVAFTRCSDCDVDLVPALEPTPDDGRSKIDVVEVLETANLAESSAFQAMLNDAGIEFSTDQTPHDQYFAERLGGSNYAVRPVRFYVRSEDAAEARELVTALRASTPDPFSPE